MGLRFRRRLRIFPGLWLNVSKRSGSLSAGGRGVDGQRQPEELFKALEKPRGSESMRKVR